jgi:anthranilate synthase component 1
MEWYYPPLAEVRALAASGQYTVAPIYRELLADMETPVSAFRKVAQDPYAYLLESVEGGEQVARYSFVGVDPYLVLRVEGQSARYCWRSSGATTRLETRRADDPLELVRAELARSAPAPVAGLPRFHGGAVGYLAYETVSRYEPRVPVPVRDPLGLPEAIFCFTDAILVFDHARHRLLVIAHVRLDGDVEAEYRRATAIIDGLVERLTAVPGRKDSSARPALDLVSLHAAERAIAPSSNMSPAAYEQRVRRAKEYIVAGDIIQVVLSQRLAVPTAATPFTIYRALRHINPSPYMYYLDMGDFTIAGASPEMLLRVEDGVVQMRPIAGTRPRGATEVEDRRLEAELRTDIKERAEHVMLVDLGRNDVGRVCRPGSVQVERFMDVERYSHVMHLVSHITGRLDQGHDAYSALRSAFPAGTLSGAPKVRAMEIIAEVEGERRGVYGGAVGYCSYSGSMDTAIAIRTLVIKDGIAYLQVGAGIVADSDPEREYQETMNKAGALLRALHQAEEIERGHYAVAAR